MVKFGNKLESSRKDGILANTDNIYDKRTGEMQETINQKIANVSPADEEDLTKTIDEEGRSVTKFADRSYSPSNFSGKGYKILRKNIQKVSLAVTNITVNSVPSADGYVSFIINGIETHVDLVVSTDNTTALVAQKIATKLSETMTEYEVSANASSVSLTRKFGGVASSSSFSANSTGVSCVITDTDKPALRNIITANMLNQPNTIYEIRYDFDLNGETIEVPEGCIIKFNGGSLDNGKINFCDTKIKGNLFEHIGYDLDYNIKFINDKSEVCVDDFGADPQGEKISNSAINKAIQYVHYNKITRPINFYGTYLIDDAIMLEDNVTLLGNGSSIIWEKLKWTMVFGNDPFRDGGYKNIKISGFVIDCDNAWTYIYEDGKDKSWPRGVFAFSNVDGLIIENCKRTYPGSIQPAWICGCSNVTFRNCNFERTLTAEQFSGESNGIWIYSTGKECKNILIEDCTIKGYRDECIGIINTKGVNKDWSYTEECGSISNVEIRNNKLIGGSYAITIASTSNSGYVEDVQIHNNQIKNSTIIVRASAKGNHVIEKNSFYFEENPKNKIEVVLVEQNTNSSLNVVRISGNNIFGETNNLRFLQIGKCKNLIIEGNNFLPRYNIDDSGIILRGPITNGVLIKDNYVKANTVLTLINSIVNTTISMIGNIFNGWCGMSLGDNGNPFVIHAINNIFNVEVIMSTSGNGHVDNNSVFSGNVINGCIESSFLNSIFTNSSTGTNQLIYKGSRSATSVFNNIPNNVYEGWAQSIANTTTRNGICIGTSKGIPIMIRNSTVMTLNGVNIPKDFLSDTTVFYRGNLNAIPTKYLNKENKGFTFYDEGHCCNLEWDGEKWIPLSNKIGSTENRPVFDSASSQIYKGLQYYDTDLNKNIIWNGSAWVNVDGTALS